MSGDELGVGGDERWGVVRRVDREGEDGESGMLKYFPTYSASSYSLVKKKNYLKLVETYSTLGYMI